MSALEDFDPRGPLPDGHTLLEASAGTGKTHTITTLVARLVAERGIELPRLLVVTFTRAAASELRERVRTRLAEVARTVTEADPGRALEDDAAAALIVGAGEDPTEVARRGKALRRASEQLDEATITTIHGFCQRMLTVSALETAVDLDAELLQDERPLQQEVADDLAARELRGADPGWYAYLRDVARIDHADREELVVAATAGVAPRLLPDPTAPAGTQEWSAACQAFADVWAAHRDRLAEELRALTGPDGLTSWRRSNGDDPCERTVERVDAWLDSTPGLPDSRDWMAECGIGWLLGRFRGDRERGWHPVLDAAIDLVEACHRSSSDWLARFAANARVEADRRKRERRALAFDDQLRRLADALSDPERSGAVVDAVRGRYDAALVDEFQDTDPLQWTIFARAFGDQRLVLIGDPKQAIYGFRGADLPTYLRARDQIPPDRRFSLPVNWRSDQRFLDAVNALFTPAGAFADPRLHAPPVRAVAHHRDDGLAWPDGGVRPGLRLRFVSTDAAAPDAGLTGKERPRITKGWAERHLPTDVASQIRGLLAEGPRLTRDGETRELAPGDIAVLVRTNRQATRVHERLLACGLPATLARAGSVFASTEATELLRLLEALREPGRESLARTAAATRLFGWRAADLLDPAHEEAWERWVGRLREWSRLWHERGVMTALRTVFADAEVWPRLLATSDGERATANLSHLAERLHAVEHAERLGPAALVGWLLATREEAREGETPATEDAELRLERDDAAVQVVTVHASKGLEYPVVLCPFLWDGRLLAERDKKVLRFHDPDDDARVLDVHTDQRGEPKRDNLELARRQRHEENLRLAYVALTRAAHHAVVWWGRFSEAEESPLAALLHRPAGTDSFEAGKAAGARDEADLRADLGSLADRSRREAAVDEGPIIGIEELAAPPDAPEPWTPPTMGEAGPLAVRPFARRLDRAWQRASFTRLARHIETPPEEARGELGRGDDEADQLELVDATAGLDHPAAGPEPDLPLADLPRGPAFGDAVHRILELTDFRAAPGVGDGLASVTGVGDGLASVTGVGDGLASVTDRIVARSSVLDASHRDRLVAGLGGVLATPLGADLGDARLSDIPRADRLDELAFELPLAGGDEPTGWVTLARLAEVLDAHPDGRDVAEVLRTGPHDRRVRGFLTGSVDLVARIPVAGRKRYLVVDYKTTWLGERADPANDVPAERSTVWHYRPEALHAAMRPHAYQLQAVLYLVAVHRHLRSRLGSAYDPDRDLAGVAYLFVRGMAGAAARRADGGSCGVWAWHPSGRLVEDCSQLLATGSEGA
ncbi:hypothetical protein ER308_07890 [Egibacter rhizosphaerae]|uniref:RecBCD enzyme subunit RecB n=1 Tax=Egibacter rhizosphaerae TaxID=1670831 RepID=A0A411YE73_9ACTN|nr:UvrD-helicase domain-containing protein [Egibacter rhizosphaerae]QBI19480.1 hypothetical protein ER308_07890 [Egibacter rhizosphaerae]